MKKIYVYVFFAVLGSFAFFARAELTAHYDFNEKDAAVLTDRAGNANGTAVDVDFGTRGAPAASFGHIGSFNGTSSYIQFGSGCHPAVFDLGTDDFTVSGWFKVPLNFQETNVTLFRSMERVKESGWSLEIGRADRSYKGKLFFTVGGEKFSEAQVMSDVRLDDDQWHFVAVVNRSGALLMYVDNVLQVDSGMMVPGVSATAAPNVESYFGRNRFVYCAGQLDEWRIYDSALSENELTRLWTSGEK